MERPFLIHQVRNQMILIKEKSTDKYKLMHYSREFYFKRILRKIINILQQFVPTA